MSVRFFLIIPLLAMLFIVEASYAQTGNPIIFVTQVPKPDDFGNLVSTFANHRADPISAPRGGDLWIRYADGQLRNLTQDAGFGESGFQGQNGITVRDPVVHWNGNKVLFSMVVGSPGAFERNAYRFQLYEMSGIGRGEQASVTKVRGQLAEYNNVMPAYTPNDNIVFVSDAPRNRASHLYPQLDEYESTPTNTGIWLLDRPSQQVRILDHSPSGDFHPTVDSFGRVIFSRWDHLQQDQQAESGVFGARLFSDESLNAGSTQNRNEIFPEARSIGRRERADVSLHQFNVFFPWMMFPDGTGLETLNHVGRHELGEFFQRSFTQDGNLQDFLAEQEEVL